MRLRSAIVAGLIAAAVLLGLSALEGARASDCGEYRWSHFDYGGLFEEHRSVPADVRPWLFARCEWMTSGCALVAAGDVVPVSAEEPCVAGRGRFTLIPERPLKVGSTYMLSCAESPVDDYDDVYEDPYPLPEGRLRVVRSDAATPISMTIEDAHMILSDDSDCGGPGLDSLEIEVDLGVAADAFFAEGGRIDVTSPRGDLGSIEVADATWNFPPEEGDWMFVAVAADGTRAEPVVLKMDEIRRDAVYVPRCGLDARSPVPLALLVPIFGVVVGHLGRVRRSR